ncbi:MAG: UDP-N-acetylmuramate dehydrogenase [Fluviicola sp.]|jgi:UDP-N-acetylmuramate dehydrogenase
MTRFNVSLAAYNTFGIDVQADALTEVHSIEELQDALALNAGKLPLLILGGGSNILFTKPVHAFVIINKIKGVQVLEEQGDVLLVEAGSGEVWHEFVQYTVQNGWGGIENLSLIPGSVGASPMQNIGAYGVEIKDVFHSLDALEIATGNVVTFSKEACAFGYRESVFKRALKDKYIITAVRYNLCKKPSFQTGYGAIQQELEAMGVQDLSVRSISEAVIRIRQSKLPDPKVLGNAGSFFKNPVVSAELAQRILDSHPNAPHYPQADGTEKLAAGWLIEQCGLKGFRKGNCGVHEKQALVLVNYGGATGNEIYALSQLVLDTVQEKFGVLLEREVNIY